MVLNLGYNPSNMPNGMQDHQAFMASLPPNVRSLTVKHVPNLTEQENLHHGHKKRAIVSSKNHFTTDVDYTNKIMIVGGIISLVGFAYILSPFRPRQTYSLFSF